MKISEISQGFPYHELDENLVANVTMKVIIMLRGWEEWGGGGGGTIVRG